MGEGNAAAPPVFEASDYVDWFDTELGRLVSEDERRVLLPLLGKMEGRHLITSAVEHPAVTEVFRWLEGEGFRVSVLPVDETLLTVAGHKLYAPKGVGALFVRPGVSLAPLMFGAPHERGLRPGTEAVSQVVALGAAARLAPRGLAEEAERLRTLRHRLGSALTEAMGADNVRVNGDPEHRLPNTLSLSLRGVRADALLAAISDRVAASSGSACHANDVRLSPVLRAMGVEPEWGMGTLRLSVGRYTTAEELDEAVCAIAAEVRNRQAAPAPAGEVRHA